MANIQLLTHPTIQDREALGEFAESLLDRAPSIEKDMARLSKAPTDRVVIADLFRSLHNIKGDAALCKVELAIQIAHPIESLLTRLRAGELRYSRLLGEVILLAVDRLELAIEALVAGRTMSHLKLVALVEGLEQLSLASQKDLDRAAAQVIKAVTGFNPTPGAHVTALKPPAPLKNQDRITSDLQFFNSLALQFEARSDLFLGRTARILDLALETNRVAGTPVDRKSVV